MRRSVRPLIIAAALAATLVAVASPANAALTVRANWQMNSLPTLVDSAGGDNNGTTKNITLKNGYYSFNGTSSAATTPDKANLDPGTLGIRLSARVSITTIPESALETYDIVRKGVTTTTGGYYKMEILKNASGHAVAACRFKDSSGRAGEAYGTVNLVNKGFVTITCTKTSTGVTVSAGGQTVTAPKTLGSISNSAPVFIGTKGDATDYFKGLMDWVKIEIG
jgi:hypothetical protein